MRQSSFSHPARIDLERWLCRRLSLVSHDALYLEWQVHRAVYGQPLPSAFFKAADEQGTSRGRLYAGFVRATLAEGLARFFGDYPVVARLWAETMLSWVNFAAEALGRLRADWPVLRRTLLKGLPAPARCRVRRLAAGLSDPHLGGRVVMIFACGARGQRLVYKPRDLRADAAYFRLLAALNTAGLRPRLRVAATLLRDHYGWMEHLAPAPCRSRAAAARYYRRIGALIALHYVLRAGDGHEENWIAAGEHPVCIDLETLWQPTFLGRARLDRTVARTGILPLRGYRAAGLGDGAPRRTLLPQRCWSSINSDGMRCKERRTFYRSLANAPRLGADFLRPSDFAADVLAGFDTLANPLVGIHRRGTRADRNLALLRGASRRLRALPRRWLPRATAVYLTILVRSLRADCLRDGEQRARCLRATLPSIAPCAVPRTRTAERRALAQLDVPRFAPEACTVTAPAWPRRQDLEAWREELQRQRPVLAEALVRQRSGLTRADAASLTKRSEINRCKSCHR